MVITQGLLNFLEYHVPSTIGLWRWTRSHSRMALLITASLGETNWLVNRLFSSSVQDEQISVSFFWIDPSSWNPTTFFLSKRTDAPFWIRSSIKVRQKVSIPPNFPRQGASNRILSLDRSVTYQRFSLVFFHLLICLSEYPKMFWLTHFSKDGVMIGTFSVWLFSLASSFSIQDFRYEPSKCTPKVSSWIRAFG